jgi:hypothetical protein
MLLALLVPLTVGGVSGGSLERLETAETYEGTVYTLVVSTTSRTPREVRLPLALPDGVAITRMTMMLDGEDEPLVSEALAITEAREAFDEIVRWSRDPALLEHVVTVRGNEHSVLRVFPLVKGQNATITIVAGESDNLTPETSLVARFGAKRPILASAKDPRSLGKGFHGRTQAVPDVPNSRALLTGAARPQRAVNRAFVEIVADQDELRPPRRVVPRVAVRERRPDPRALDEASTILSRQMHEALRTNQSRTK